MYGMTLPKYPIQSVTNKIDRRPNNEDGFAMFCVLNENQQKKKSATTNKPRTAKTGDNESIETVVSCSLTARK